MHTILNSFSSLTATIIMAPCCLFSHTTPESTKTTSSNPPKPPIIHKQIIWTRSGEDGMRTSTKHKDTQRLWSGKVRKIHVGATDGYELDHLHDYHAHNASTLDIVRPEDILKRINSRRRRSGKKCTSKIYLMLASSSQCGTLSYSLMPFQTICTMTPRTCRICSRWHSFIASLRDRKRL